MILTLNLHGKQDNIKEKWTAFEAHITRFLNRYYIYTYWQIIIPASIGLSTYLQKPSASRLNEEICKTKHEK
jgi:hypothetical protein